MKFGTFGRNLDISFFAKKVFLLLPAACVRTNNRRILTTKSGTPLIFPVVKNLFSGVFVQFINDALRAAALYLYLYIFTFDLRIRKYLRYLSKIWHVWISNLVDMFLGKNYFNFYQRRAYEHIFAEFQPKAIRP